MRFWAKDDYMNMQMSTIKTGISVFISILISKLLKLEFPFFVALAVIMPIEESFSSSFKSGKNRMVGTIIGALIGILFVLIKPGNPVLCGIGIVIIIYLCNLFKFGSSAPIGGIVFISIMVNLKGKNPFSYSMNRVVDTLIGVCIVIVVNYLIPSNNNKVFAKVVNLEGDLLYYIREIVCSSKHINLEELNKKILNIEGQLNKPMGESKVKMKNQKKLNDAKILIGLYKNTYEHLNMISSLENTCSLDIDNYEKLKSMNVDNNIHQGECKNMKMSAVFNYHVSKIIENLNMINEKLASLKGDTSQ
jgi:uncharacterized membrane protein YgaE (UPF0421/DUF939 family)